jgi:plastocyanin domain-containing protein
MMRIICALLILLSYPAFALDEYIITLKNHLFQPSIVVIPANKKVKLKFLNLDTTPEEIDSFDLNREKVVFGQSTAIIYVGPLKEGEYGFFGEFHPQTAVGVVKVVPESEVKNAH